jgi:hypothetical protein
MKFLLGLSVLVMLLPLTAYADAGHALQFEGNQNTGQYIYIPGNSAFIFHDADFSVELWVNLTQPPAGDWHLLLSNQVHDNFQLSISPSGQLCFHAADNMAISDSLNWTLGQWYCVAVTRYGGTLTIYRDCSPVISGYLPYDVGNLTMINIGFRIYDHYHPFNGMVDEIRIWNVARNQSELESDMRFSLTGNEPGLVGYWRLDEGEGDIVYDLSPNGINGYLGNSLEPDGEDPTWQVSTAPIINPRSCWRISTEGDNFRGDGSAENPLRTIQFGVNLSRSGDTVLVEPGTYFENVNFYGRSIVLCSEFPFNGDTSSISSTIIDGNGAGAGITVENGENEFSQIMGLTIQNGNNFHGGGILCQNGSRPVISNNYIRDNTAAGGGGISVFLANPLIRNNRIFNNFSGSGGGIDTYDSAPIIEHNLIYSNSAIDGAGIYCRTNGAIIVNNTIYSNVTSNRGGGICAVHGATPIVRNTILWGNSSPVGNQLGVLDYGSFDVSYSDVQDGWDGIGNLSTDPLFVDPINSDFHLSWSNFPANDGTKSSCIDSGDPAIDQDNDCPSRSDVGAFAFDQKVAGDANYSGTVNGIDVTYLVSYLKGGNLPICFMSADANGSCDVNGLDVVYLVCYLKGIGPGPVDATCEY